MAEHGFLGINFDEEYGGAGMSEFEAMLLNERSVGSARTRRRS
ncbi:acyl-CoA dehydrogenase family protein [Natrinema saccharevitans]|nr:acyl-CoA dehydrogenase family protein [Natrinema saccharevitans]